MEKIYKTTLEKGVLNVSAVLDEKLKATSSVQVVDYVAFSVDNLDSNIAQAKEAIEDLKDYIKTQTSIKEEISLGTAQWLQNEGIDKLEGMRVSSITTYTPKPKTKLKITDESYWLGSNKFTKTTIDETAIKNFLESTEVDYSEYAILEIIHEEPKIKINRKRA